MTDRFKYSEVRQKIIDDIRIDLMGPREEEEVLGSDPRYEYLIGMIDPQNESEDYSFEDKRDVDADTVYGDDYTSTEDEENEPSQSSYSPLPSSIGISFYIHSDTQKINLDVSWGDYVYSTEKDTDKEGKERSYPKYTRHPMMETVVVNFSEFNSRTKEYRLVCDSNVYVHVSRIPMKGEFFLVTAYVVNKRKNTENVTSGLMFQVGLKAYSIDGTNVFYAEHLCRKILETDEFYFEKHPIMGRGRGCAAVWGDAVDGKTSYIKSAFIPEYEFPSVSAALDGFDRHFFSTFFMSHGSKRSEIVARLTTLTDSYDKWIKDTLLADTKMLDADFKTKVGNKIVSNCQNALSRIREGIEIIKQDDDSFDAFCFMNRVIALQNGIKGYSQKHGSGIECNFADFINPNNPDNDFGWRPFQIAFILQNIAGIVNPRHKDREIVDLLYFPTGGGKTEAYLGLMAFVIAYRRLKAKSVNNYNLDGGVTVILRYTLRLLTTQQRDRITKMVVAAEYIRREYIRRKNFPKYGNEPISIGFWVGGGVTPNSFEDFKERADEPQKASSARNHLQKQLLTCPFCGQKLTEENFNIDVDRKAVEIFCSDKDCWFYRYNDDRVPIPVYLVDEEIYAKCPTIILSTVDKFAKLPWDVNTNSLFGRVDRKCERHGYVAIGAKHQERHNKKDSLPASITTKIKPFLPPELIIQDELHLITGPLGTIYGAYETLIEDMCTYDGIKPKYVVSTATIKNAAQQTKCLYARNNTTQFPPSGFEIGDSFFIREIPVKDNPFRKYVGLCAPGYSVKNALLRLYAILLQSTFVYSQQDEFKDSIDPYYSLVGYFNSIRELGGAVRLIQDDIPKRIYRIKNKCGHEKTRPLFHNAEITSRISSYKIPEKLSQLETTYESKDCLDTALATNMIAVGMDVERLGLMVVLGQPKQNSEYIQATSRIGRTYPGLVVTLYNAYRPRDLSHYENFTGYHSQMYRFVEGTTSTPFSARARDRVLHALIIAAIRLKFPNMSENANAADIDKLSDDEINSVKNLIIERLNIVKPSAQKDALDEIDQFIDWWKYQASQSKPLCYFIGNTEKHNRLMSTYDSPHQDSEKPTLQAMRDVESSSSMYYWERGN